MKKRFFLLVLQLLILSLVLTAQVQWQDDGVPVRQGENIIWKQATVTNTDGTFVTAWSDTRDGVRGIYAQKIDPSGNNYWGETGLEVYNPNRMQSLKEIISSTDNCTIICWVDYTDLMDYSWVIRVQKIDEYGNRLWGEEGILLEEASTDNLQILSHSDGGAYMFWYSSPQSTVRGIRILPDGSIAPGWQDSFNILPSTTPFKVSSDQANGVIFSSAFCYELYSQRVDEDGNKLWGNNGTLLHSGDTIINRLDISSSVEGEYYFSWIDYSTTATTYILFQKLDSNGDTCWDAPVVITSDNYIYIFIFICNNDSEPIIAWHYGGNIFVQKIGTDGNLLWGTDGITIIETDYSLNFNSVILKNDNSNGCLISWTRRNSTGIRDIIQIQHLDSEGNFQFGEEGITVYEIEDYGTRASLAASDQNIYLCWMVRENNNTSLKHQILDLEGNIYLDENGEEMCVGLSGRCRNMQLLGIEDNSILLWKDYRANHARIYMQILNSDGSPQLEEDGVPITTFSPHHQNVFDATLGTNSETIVAAWSESKDNFEHIYIQGIDTIGNYLWSDSTGICLSSPEIYSSAPKISCYDNSGIDEYYLGWSFCNFWNFVVVAQKVIDGEPQWSENGIIISGEYPNCEIIDIKDRFYIWEELSWPETKLRVSLLEEDGTIAAGWPEYGAIIAEGIFNSSEYSIQLIQEGLLITWQIEENTSKIYGQIIDYDGNFLWQDEGILLISENDISDHEVIYNGNIYLAWNQYYTNYQLNLTMQKFNTEGEEQWQEEGIQIASDIYYHHDINLSSVDNDILVVWEHREEDQSSQIMAQLISSEGQLQYEQPGLTVCDGYMDQKLPQIYMNGTNAYIAWHDERSTYFGEGTSSIPGVYAQKLTLDPTFAENETIASSAVILHNNYPNPFNPTTIISFSLTAKDAKSAKLEIFNIKGQKIKDISPSLCHPEFYPPGRTVEGRGKISVIWDGTDSNNKPVGSGIYFYQLNVNGKTEAVKKCLLLK